MVMPAGETRTTRSQTLLVEVYAVYCTVRDPRVPWLAKLIAACAVGYLFSPIQLIPDWIPVLGFADNVLALAAAAALVRKLTPPAVLEDCRERARAALMERSQSHHGVATRVAFAGVLAAWFLVTSVVSVVVFRLVFRIR
jgi:uncharacterized membrane protein YkvA (DUF1232 family)